MTLRHLRIFAAVVDCGTMHAAAERLFITQPTITQAVKELEKHYGCRLFQRLGRRLVITPAGQQLLTHARALLAEADRMEQTMAALGRTELLRIGATISVGEQMLLPLVTGFQALHPELRLEVTVDNSESLRARLASGQLDGCIMDSTDDPRGGLEVRPFYRDRLALIAAPGHPLAGAAGPITPDQLARCSFVMREQGSVPRQRLAAYFDRHGLSPRVSWSSANLHTVIQAVAAGQGVSLLYSVLVQREMDAGLLVELPVPELEEERDIALVWHKNCTPSPALEQLAEYCRHSTQPPTGGIWPAGREE